MKDRVGGLPKLSEMQTEIMNLIWAGGQATVADVHRALSKRRQLARNTVQTLLSRLEQKGWLSHSTQGNAFVYVATEEKKPALQSMVSRLVDTAFAGSVENLIMTLIDGRQISDKEAENIQALIQKAAQGTKKTQQENN